MDSYEDHFKQRGIEQFVIDGAIDPAKWQVCPTRIMFLLKENYGYQDCGVFRVEQYAHRWLTDRIRTYCRAMTLAAAVQESIRRGSPLSATEINRVADNSELLHATLDTIAVLNIKKHSGGSQSNDTEIRKESKMNARLLHDQILALAPTIIVAGGSVCWDSLIYDVGLFGDVPNCHKFGTVVRNGMLLCHAYHPAARRSKEFDIPRLLQVIFDGYRSSNMEGQLSSGVED